MDNPANIAGVADTPAPPFVTIMNTPHRLLLTLLGSLLLSAWPAQAATVTATYNAVTDVPVTAASYTAAGNGVILTLNCAPPTGTNLTVVKNTGLGFINGKFTNLAQGQSVTLFYNGITYNFVANYYGGTGNDLVLQWAATRPVAWGPSNTYGQLGDHTTLASNVPVPVETAGVLSGKTVVSLSAGSKHTLGLCSDGTVAAWGFGYDGELGNDYMDEHTVIPVPVIATGALAGKTVVAVAAGGDHSVALCADGTVATWGRNLYGQLGNNSTTNSLVPVAVNTSGALAGKTVVAVSAGGYHTLALCSDGTLAAWGWNLFGQIGANGTTNCLVPVAVNASGSLAGKTVIAASAGGYHSLALCSDGTVVTWGGNSYGQLGNSVNTSGTLLGKTVIGVSAGFEFSLALCSDGTLAAWGSNTRGQLGDGTGNHSSVPVAVTASGAFPGKTVVAVSAGGEHGLALCSDGAMVAWGGDHNLQISAAPGTVLASGERFLMATSGSSASHCLHTIAVPAPVPLVMSTPVQGNLSVAGQFNDWSFFGRAGRKATIVVNPGSSGSPAPAPPQLNWAKVQLLDANGAVLANTANATAGSILFLSDIVLPADGTYRIRVAVVPGVRTLAAGPAPASAGNYLVGVWDSTSNVRSLNLGQRSSGVITTPYQKDQWTFSAEAGQQIQFDLLGTSSAGVVFKLTGPSGYVAFQDATDDSPFINLPSSGSYVLTAYPLGGATGTYSFVMKQTSVTALPLGTVYHGTWAGSGQAQLFSIPVTAFGPLVMTLSDSITANHTEIYARFGAPPTRQTYNYSANGAGASHDLLVPTANAGTWYVLVYGESIPSASGSFTVQAASNDVFLSGSPTFARDAAGNTVLTVNGAGFNGGSVISLIGGNGTVYSAISSSPDLPTQMTATFATATLPVGTYSVKVTQANGFTAQLPSSVFIQRGSPMLTTSIEVPNPIGRHVAATLYVNYANTGTAPMPAPLLVLGAKNPSGLEGAFLTLDASLQSAGFWTSANPAGYSQSVQILASGATPGVLAPGESIRVPVYYAGWITTQWDGVNPYLNFSLKAIETDNATAVYWPSKEALMQPANISAAAWHIMFANLFPQLGNSAGGYVQMLDNQASYLGRLGQKVTDVGKLWSFAVEQTENAWPVRNLAGTVDDSLPVPGALSLSFGRAFNQTIPGRFQSGPLGLGWFTRWQQNLSVAADGTVTVSTGSGAHYVFQPDSRHGGQYFSSTGDYNKLTSEGGGYQLTATDGTITAFNASGTLNYLQDTNGNRITAGYAGGRLASLTATSGQSLTIAYGAAGLIATVTDSAGRVTTYAYDGSNQHLMSVTAFDGRVTSYGYNAIPGAAAQNALTSIAFPDGTHQYFTHDTQGRLAGASADGGALARTLAYSNGQVSITDATPSTSSLYFDQNGQVARTVDALGNSTYFNHDNKFNLVNITNALGAAASYTYNSVGKVTSATDFLGNTTGTVFSGAQNQLSALTDAKGNKTLYAYNPAGNLLTTTYANATAETFTYDPLGNALSFTNAAGEPISYTHNAAGQLTSATFAGGSSFTYAYDNRGHLTSATDVNGAVIFTYHPTTGYLTSVANPNGTSLTFGYDTAGRRISMVDHSGFTTNYNYDSLGRMAALKDGSNNVIVNYGYDGNGRLSQKINGNGTYTTYQYDAAGKVLHLINYASGGTVNSRFDDTYNALGLKTAETTLDGAWAYTYDANGQLVHAVFASNNPGTLPNQDLAYNYDALGNRTSTVINGVSTFYVSNNMNQYTSVGGTGYGYDVKGNLTSDGANTYAYNFLNQLVTTTDASGTASYTYDALGQRASTASGGQTTQYQIDPAEFGNVVGTYNGDGTLDSHYVYGLGLVSQIADSSTRYYDFDATGSTVGLSGANGIYQNSYVNLPFGRVLATALAVTNPFEFSGQFGVSSEKGGISFMRARNYCQNAGRFTSMDPIGILGGDVNYYRYVLNQPTTYSDPDGTTPLIVTGGAIGAIAGAVSYGYDHRSDGKGNRAGFTASVVLGATTGAVAGATGGISLLEGVIIAGETATIAARVDGESPSEAATKGLVGMAGALVPTPKPVTKWGSGNFGSWVHTFLAENKHGKQLWYDLVGHNLAEKVLEQINELLKALFSGDVATVSAQDPNAMYGPTGYGAANFVTSFGNTFAYRITYENDGTATAPAQSVGVTDNLDANLDWTTFQLTGIGFGDNTLTIPAGSQHFQTTVSMTYNGQTFNVEIEAGIHSDTGQVYATFQSLDPNTELPPANVLTGFLPPEDGTGRGQGYLNFTVSPKSAVATGVVIPNVALITFDAGQSIATNQVSETNPAAGTDPTKEAHVTIDANVPTAQVTSFGGYVPATFIVSWSGSGGPGGSGIASYTIYVSSDGGATYTPWLIDTPLASATYTGVVGVTYSFYVVAKSNVGTVQTANTQTAAVSAQALTNTNYWRWQNFGIPSNTGIAADNADPDGDGILNLMEFATHTSPTVPNPMPGQVVLNGGNLEFTYVRSKAAMSEGVASGVEWSDSLLLPIWSTVGVTETILSDDGIVQQVKATLPGGSNGQRFVHLRAIGP